MSPHECASTLVECATSGRHPRPVVYLFRFRSRTDVRVWVAWGPKSKNPVMVRRTTDATQSDVMTEARVYARAHEVVMLTSREQPVTRDVAL